MLASAKPYSIEVIQDSIPYHISKAYSLCWKVGEDISVV